jgi:demethylmenaquinone methyltransferase / 2-methoxy-6-polyprenyl-1,4-benzoquinol methylase
LPPAAEKPRYVAAMFGRIAWRYDLMNTLMTGGQDARWRALVARALDGLEPPARILDVGAGTGRIAEAIATRHPTWQVVAADFTLPMLLRAPRSVGLAAADALRLPFAAEQFDAVVSGFVVRNLAEVEAGIAEQVRVLRRGGRLVILETTPGPPAWPLSAAYRLYFRQLVPLVGGLIAGDASAYTYLPESTLQFTEPERLADLLRANGVRDVSVRRLTFGSVAMTSGRKQ